MKELSIEEKAKAYDSNYKNYAELINRLEDIKEAIKKQNYGIAMDVLCKPYPEFQVTTHSELKEESEGERIRKRICKLLWDNAPYEEAQEYIAWLEKQGNPTEDELEALRMAAYEPTKNWSEKLQSLYEKLTHCEQKSVIEMKTPEESLGIDSDTYNKIVDECIYSEQKLANKAEPKFKIGDNIEPIDTCLGSSRTIYKICDGWYETNQGTLDFEFENNWRLIEQKPAWSEEDDKIIEEIINDIECARAINYHDSKEGYEFRENWLESLKDRVQPQLQQGWTEEDERIIKRIDSLLYSINESEFEDIHAWLEFLKNRVQPKQEWSKEDEGYYDAIIAKLEVTREDALLTDNEMDFLKSLEKRVFPKSNWNEEDITRLKSAITLIQNPLIACDEVNDGVRIKTVDWLKSIENKVLLQSKQEWSEKDKHMLQKVIDFMNHPDLIKATPTLSKNTINWLKFLEERYTWKPSESQLEALDDFIYAKYPNIEKYEAAVKSLYQDLKKLKG